MSDGSRDREGERRGQDQSPGTGARGGEGGRGPEGRPPFSAAVLAGGRGKRLGADKTTLNIGGVPVLDRVVSFLRDIFPEVLVVVQDEGSLDARRFGPGVRVVGDVLPGKGPLGGIYTALSNSSYPQVFVMACDMPYPQEGLVRRLLSLADQAEAVVPRRGEYIEPLFAVYSRSLKERIRSRLERGLLKIHRFLDTVDVRFLEEEEIAACDPDFRSFFNINTREDLRRALRMEGRNAG